ncbi:unnamed protein product, partial [Nesidiocoris tenuis]
MDFVQKSLIPTLRKKLERIWPKKKSSSNLEESTTQPGRATKRELFSRPGILCEDRGHRNLQSRLSRALQRDWWTTSSTDTMASLGEHSAAPLLANVRPAHYPTDPATGRGGVGVEHSKSYGASQPRFH